MASYGTPERYMAYVVRVIRDCGWVSRANAQEIGQKSTADVAVRYIETVTDTEGTSDLGPTTRDYDTAVKAKQWCLEQANNGRATPGSFVERQLIAMSDANANRGNIAFLATIVNNYLEREKKNLFRDELRRQLRSGRSFREAMERARIMSDAGTTNPSRASYGSVARDPAYRTTAGDLPGCFGQFNKGLIQPRGCKSCIHAGLCTSPEGKIKAKDCLRPEVESRKTLTDKRAVRRVVVRRS